MELLEPLWALLKHSRKLSQIVTGDTIKFTSLNPPKILVTGRYKHFISAFGEHVISEEVEKSISELCEIKEINIREFTVAPMINPKKGLPHHEWWIEFENNNVDLEKITKGTIEDITE